MKEYCVVFISPTDSSLAMATGFETESIILFGHDASHLPSRSLYVTSRGPLAAIFTSIRQEETDWQSINFLFFFFVASLRRSTGGGEGPITQHQLTFDPRAVVVKKIDYNQTPEVHLLMD